MGHPDLRLLAALLCVLQVPAHAQAPRAGQADPPPDSSSPGDTPPERSPAHVPPGREPQDQSGDDTPADPSGSTSDTAAAAPLPVPIRLAASGPGVSAGMPVKSESGSLLGFVVDVLPGPAGTEASGYAVIAGGAGGTTPVPYEAAAAMLQDGMLVIDHARFAAAPKVSQSQIEDPAKSGWKAKADVYWSSTSNSAGPPGQEPPLRDDEETPQGTDPPPQR